MLFRSVNLKGLTCGSGKIEVDSGSMKITLDKPYQATIVETASTPPSPPVVVNLSNTAIGNNLLIRPPMTLAGTNIQQTARMAAEKTGDVKRDEDKRHDKDSPSQAEAKTSDEDRRREQERINREFDAEDKALAELRRLQDKGVTVGTNPAEDEHVTKVFKNNNPNLNQIGWAYISLSPNGNNFTAISLTNDNKTLVVVTQDRQKIGRAHV